ncbi:uncharacterized protein LOC143043828 [Mytilus galloprovincialis]|uniref:uncharacterized protein LOC143043828 n=1 Tax=Mytilus galloprovincialis TaxID=29158 RepID=UPI003F7B9E53
MRLQVGIDLRILKNGHVCHTIATQKNDRNNANQFSESKNFIQTIADVSLMMANISQLRAVLGFGENNQFYGSLITLIILSLLSHTLFVFFTVIRTHFKNRHQMVVHQRKQKENEPKEEKKDVKVKTKKTAENKEEVKQPKVTYFCCLTKNETANQYEDSEFCTCPHCHTDLYLSYICYCLVFITICSNIGITGIGIS